MDRRNYSNSNRKNENKLSAKSAAIMEDVLPGYEEYLLLLQEKNRLVKKLRKKDKKQVDLERKEQGFSLYVNGANAELNIGSEVSPPAESNVGNTKLPRTAGAIRRPHGPITHRDLEYIAREEREKMREKQRAKTAPSKTRRKNWNVESIEVTTDKGNNRKIHAPEILTGKYEEDFESDDSSDNEMEIDAANHSRPISPKKTSYVKKKAGEMRQDIKDNRLTLNVNDVKRLRQSLEMNHCIKQSLAMEISSIGDEINKDVFCSDEDSILEVIQDESGDELAPTIEEESEDDIEEEIVSSVDKSSKKHSPFKPGDTIVLEFASNLKRKEERILSTVKRKENYDGALLSARKSSEKLISPRSGHQVILKETKELQSVSKSKKQLQPLVSPSTRKSYSTGRDSQEDTAAVLAALQAENAQAEKYSKESKSKSKCTQDKVLCKSAFSSLQSPHLSTDLTDKKLSQILDKVLIMPPRQQCRLVKLLEKLDDDKLKSSPLSDPLSISKREPLKALSPMSGMIHKQNNDIEVNIEILSNWGHPSRLGLTEFQFYNQDKELIPVDVSGVVVHGVQQAHAPLDVLFNHKTKTTKERHMWICDYSGGRLEFVIFLRNPYLDKPFELSIIKIWNWNKSINGLDMGGRHARVFVGGELVFDGDLDKGCGNHIYDYSTAINIKNNSQKNLNENGSKPPSRENSHHTFRSISRSSLSSASSSSSSRPVSATQPPSPVRSDTRTVLNSDNRLNHPVIIGDRSDSSPESDNHLRDPHTLPDQPKCKTPRKSKRLVARLDGHSSETESSRSVTDSNDKKSSIPFTTSKSDNSLSGSSDNKISKSSSGNKFKLSPTHKPPLPRKSSQLCAEEDFEPEDVSMITKLKDMAIREGSRKKDIPKWLNKDDFSGERFEGPPESRGNSRNSDRSESRSSLLQDKAKLSSIESLKQDKTRLSSRRSASKVSEPVDDLINELDDVLTPFSGARVGHLPSVLDEKKSSKSGRISEDVFNSDGSPMTKIQKNRSKWRDEKSSKLEESWGSLSFFNKSQRGRLSVDMADDALDEYLPSARKPGEPESIIEEEEDIISDGNELFTIPELPYGGELVINITTTWGDHHYVGLTGIEIFASTGELVQISKVSAVPSDINILNEYNKDPRVISNIIDGCNRTRDDVHMWLTPFTASFNHYIYLTFTKPCRVAMIRVWNYNKSRIHSYRGARDVMMMLDKNVIFKGEIARACGGIEGGTEAFGDIILFTTDEATLEEVSKNDEAFEGELFSDAEDEDVAFERPSTADDGEERPFTRAVGVVGKDEHPEQTSYVTTVDNITAYKTKSLELNFTATWGDHHYLGLTALEVIGKDGEALPVKLSMLTAQPRDVRILPGHERDDRTLDKLIDGTTLTMLDGHMWLVPFTENKSHLLTIMFTESMLVTGLRIWNYNKSREDTYRGAKIVHVKINGKQISPSQGYLIRKGPGSCHFDFVQEINFTCASNNSKVGTAVLHTGGVETSQDYEAVQMPCGFIYQFQLFSTWADPYYIGLNGLELYDDSLKKIQLTDINISAYPESINVLDNVQPDVRTPDKLITGNNDTADGNNMWLAPILPNMLNRVYVIFDQPTTISMIKIWNYSKTPSRGVKDFALLVDDLLVYNGTLASVTNGVRGIIPTCSAPQKYHTVLFTQNPDILHKEKHTIINNQAGEQDVQLLNDKKIVTKYADPKKAQSGKPVNQELRPKTSVTGHMKTRR